MPFPFQLGDTPASVIDLLLLEVVRDGNGAPFPDPRRGIHLLGDGDGEIILPAGKEMGKNQSPSGMAGPGTIYRRPYPLPVGDPI
jgi:hypothetical protein